MVLGEQAAAIPNNLPGDDSGEANVEASPKFVAVRRWHLPSPPRAIPKPQNCLHGVIPGPALSYNDREGVKAGNKLGMRWTWTDRAKVRRDEKKAARPVDRLGGSRCELTERGVAALKKGWVYFLINHHGTTS